MSYNPLVPPAEEKELLPYLSEEFTRLSVSVNDSSEGFLGTAYQLPPRVKPGMLKLFDGVGADPMSNGFDGLYTTDKAGKWRIHPDSDLTMDLARYVTSTYYTPWVTITNANVNFTLSGVCRYRKAFGRVDIQASVFHTNVARNTPIFRLATAYRPDVSVVMAVTATYHPPNETPSVIVGNDGWVLIGAPASTGGIYATNINISVPLPLD